MRRKRHLVVLGLFLAWALLLGIACRAATLGQIAAECSTTYPGMAKVIFNWTPSTPNGVVQYLDLSLSDNGFAPGTFVSTGPFPGDVGTYVWDGLVPGAVHTYRVNTFDGTTWWPSATGYVVPPWCSGPPPAVDEGCIESSIKGEFTGWSGGTLFPLFNGQYWLQASYSYLYHYEFNPRVSICPVDGTFYRMAVEGVRDTILVTPISCMETCISGSFEGWDGDTVFDLCNGQVWQQSSYSYTYHYAYRPTAFVCEVGSGMHKMWVEGVDESIYVARLR